MSQHRRPTHTRRRTGLAAAALGVAALTTLGASAPAMAAKGSGGGKGGGKTPTVTGSFSLRLLDSPDTVPNYGENVTFDVSSNATYPMVNLTCYQGGTWVTNQTVGFYPGWAWSQTFPLSSWKWTAGAADCDARLYSQNADGSNQQTLATMTFHVEP